MNVVWFCLDTLREGHLSCYGYFREVSPTINRLAWESVIVSSERQEAFSPAGDRLVVTFSPP